MASTLPDGVVHYHKFFSNTDKSSVCSDVDDSTGSVSPDRLRNLHVSATDTCDASNLPKLQPQPPDTKHECYMDPTGCLLHLQEFATWTRGDPSADQDLISKCIQNITLGHSNDLASQKSSYEAQIDVTSTRHASILSRFDERVHQLKNDFEKLSLEQSERDKIVSLRQAEFHELREAHQQHLEQQAQYYASEIIRTEQEHHRRLVAIQEEQRQVLQSLRVQHNHALRTAYKTYDDSLKRAAEMYLQKIQANERDNAQALKKMNEVLQAMERNGRSKVEVFSAALMLLGIAATIVGVTCSGKLEYVNLSRTILEYLKGGR